jgi:NMD protein affecting ribosome stability and mRNA decay
MKNPGARTGRKDRARELAERRTRSHQTPVSRAPAPPADLARCARCGVVFRRKTWRRSRRRTKDALSRGRQLVVCPACHQAETGEALGRVLLLGEIAPTQEQELRRRVRNVCTRAAFTQPERRMLALRRVEGGLEVLTTSQELAHRIAREVTKAFGGHASYAWSHSDGRLLARWESGA